MKYTFLPKAPCTFTLNNKYYRCELGRPFEVNEREARLLTSNNFKYRNHLRLVTPLPKKARASKVKPSTEEKKPLPEISKSKPSLVAYDEVSDPFVEPEIEIPVSSSAACTMDDAGIMPAMDPGEAKPNLESFTKQQIVDYAATKGVEVKHSLTKNEMLEVCKDL